MLFEKYSVEPIKSIVMKRLLIIIPILSLMLASCYREPLANATINPMDPWVGEDITFTNLSTNTAYSEWDMGDGTASSSFNVVHYYIHPGEYNVNLSSYGDKKGMSRATFVIYVTGSELKVSVLEFYDEYAIEEASVLLYESEDDWWEANIDKAVGGEQFTDRYGECMFEGLSSMEYYVDVYYRVGNEGYVNWLLGEDDIGWVRTQEVMGAYYQEFIAYVDAVTFDDTQKKSTGRPALRPDVRDVKQIKGISAGQRTMKENKVSTPRERK